MGDGITDGSKDYWWPAEHRKRQAAIAKLREATWRDWRRCRMAHLIDFGHTKKEAGQIADDEMKLLKSK